MTIEQIIVDKWDRKIRLTRERLAHIREHPEMVGLADQIAETLADPEQVVQSSADSTAHLYYRWLAGTRVGNKYLCVVVKFRGEDAFVVTAYLTDKVKKGVLLWPRES